MIKKISLVIIIGLIFFFGFRLILIGRFYSKPPVVSTPGKLTSPTLSPKSASKLSFPSPLPPKSPSPTKVLLKVPFTSQAPFGDWDELHKEACEEAVSLILHQFLIGDGRGQIPPQEADQEIKKQVQFQIDKIGLHKDLTIQETADLLLKDYYGHKNISLKYDITLEDIKKEIRKGNPVILPAAGRELKNPYFRVPGPIYHMLVAIGFDQKEIITNDPGTKRGMGFRYKPEILFNAIHDWPGNPENITQGRKGMIVVEK